MRPVRLCAGAENGATRDCDGRHSARHAGRFHGPHGGAAGQTLVAQHERTAEVRSIIVFRLSCT